MNKENSAITNDIKTACGVSETSHFSILYKNAFKTGMVSLGIATATCDREAREAILKQKFISIDNGTPLAITVKDDWKGYICSFCCAHGHTHKRCPKKKIQGAKATCVKQASWTRESPLFKASSLKSGCGFPSAC
mmetsp:Transcript_44687/g.72908  ORF Transcript_44687/g.72908 Transcript_44687/m.72908 type:complete len:135 (-) Transcript_44687:863-1267(-)